MNKKLAVILLSIVLLWCCGRGASAAQVSYVTVTVNGKALKEKAIYVEGLVYLPVDAIANALGVSYEWDPSKKRITFNGKPLTGKAIKIQGVLYVPSVSVAENTNGRIKMDPQSKALSIFTGKDIGVKTPTPTHTPVATPIQSVNEPFIPIKAENDVFKVTITNLETVTTVKGQNTSRSGNKFIIIYLSQQNISNEVQIYTGKFALVDSSRQVYEYQESLSNFWLLVLRPGGNNFGYLVFEIPVNVQPMQVVLSTTTRPPLTLNLR
ncbi:MAG: DUF4352 domain-containing protein [Candidatus Eremiobacteraeota bacterium]|nr:DUF4352 domain-containing protein [Candidatus Eremiobacteraeota bacterium]